VLFSRGLISHWPLENSALDASGNGYNGTVTGAAYAGGRLGRCLSFGTSDYVNVASMPSTPSVGKLTILAHFKRLGPASTYHTIMSSMFGNANNYILVASDGSSLVLSISVSGGLASATMSIPNTGDWHHLGLMYDGTNLYPVVDAALGTPSSASGNFIIAAGQTQIGSYLSGVFGTNGLIDELAVWTRDLTITDIKRVFLGLHPVS
jgi:hypothetical protein